MVTRGCRGWKDVTAAQDNVSDARACHAGERLSHTASRYRAQ